MVARFGFWKDRHHHLNKMTLKQLVAAYFQYYAIQGYIATTLLCTWAAVTYGTDWRLLLAAVAISFAAYSFVWYVLHRWVLHSQWMFKYGFSAWVWKRIHFDHSMDPYHLEVLFGALYTTLPAIVLTMGSIGWALDGLGGAAAGIAGGCVMTCFYEFCHCIQHLAYKPKNKRLALMKQRHMEHHFRDENGNFGITSFFWDKVFGTYYEGEERPEKSETVFNLGYTDEMAEKYPWVAAKTPDMQVNATPRERRERRERLERAGSGDPEEQRVA